MENIQCVSETRVSAFWLPLIFSEINQRQKSMQLLHFKPQAKLYGVAHGRAIPQAKPSQATVDKS